MSPTNKTEAAEALLHSLQRNGAAVRVHALDSDCVFHVQESLLANVSTYFKLVCSATHDFRPPLDLEPLQIFLLWLHGISITTKDQKHLAQAWNFGASFNIAGFQNAVMRQLTSVLLEDFVEPAAVAEAYKQPLPQGHNLLRKAFVAQICHDIIFSTEDPLDGTWGEPQFSEYGLSEDSEFYKDLGRGMCFGVDGIDLEKERLIVKDFLVQE